MDNKKMVALNEDQLEKVDGGVFGIGLAIFGIFSCMVPMVLRHIDL